MNFSFKKIITILTSAIILATLFSNVYAENSYNIDKKTGLTSENIEINYTLENADSLQILSVDNTGIIAFVDNRTAEKNDKSRYIFIDYSGNVTEFNSIYDNIDVSHKMPYVFRDGVANVNCGKETYLKENRYVNDKYQWIAKPKYMYISKFSDGFGCVKEQGGKSYLINKEGKKCFTADDFYYKGYNSDFPGTVFENGYAAYSKNGDVYYLDTNLNSTKIDLGNETSFDNNTFLFHGGTLVQSYFKKLDDDYTYKLVYRIFGHNGNETYRKEFELSKYDDLTPYNNINILANGMVMFIEPEDYQKSDYNENIKLVTIDGEMLSETDNFERYTGQYIKNIGDNLIVYKTIYDNKFNKLGELDIGNLYEVANDGSAVAGLDVNTNSKEREIEIRNLKIYYSSKISIDKNIKLLDAKQLKQFTNDNTGSDINEENNKGITVYLNNEQLTFDTEPITENDRTLVPMRSIFEALGADVLWNNATQTATAQKDDTIVSITIDNDVMLVNGQEIKLDAPARLINDSRTLIPLRAVSEAFGCDVQWDESQNRVMIAPSGWKVVTYDPNDNNHDYVGYFYRDTDEDLKNEATSHLFSKCSEYSDGLAIVSKSDINAAKKYYGYVDERGFFMSIPPIYTSAKPFKDGLATVTSDLYIGEYTIDKNGNIVGNVAPNNYTTSNEDLTLFKDEENGLFGYKDKTDKIVIPPTYTQANEFSCGLARVNPQVSFCSPDTDADLSYGYINTLGKMVIPFKYSYLSTDFGEDTAVVFEFDYEKSNYAYAYFIDKNNTKLFNGKEWVNGLPFSEGYAAVQIQGQCTDNIYQYSNEKTVWTYIDRMGNYATDKQFDEAKSFINGQAKVKIDGQEYSIDTNFNIINNK